MRVHLEARKRCYNHPHRETELVCARCKIALCADCLVEEDGARLCAICRRELADAKAARLSFGQKVVVELRRIAIGIVVVAVLVGVIAGVFAIFRPNLQQQITPEELARFRYALSGSFETEEGINVSSTVLGASVASASSEAVAYPAKQLINEYSGPGIPAWRSEAASFPQEIVVAFNEPATVQKTILVNNPAEPSETYVRHFELLLSPVGPDRGFVSAGTFEAQQTTDPQRFELKPTTGRWVMLRILDNYGSPEYTSLDEFNTYVVPASSRFSRSTPGATPSPKR